MELAGGAAAVVPLCDKCVTAKGLCTHCAKTVLPQMAKPSWIYLIGFKHVPADAPSLAAQLKEARRKQREGVRAEAHRRGVRISQLLAGQFAPVRRAA